MSVWLDPRTRLASARLVCLLDASVGPDVARACVRRGADGIGVRGAGVADAAAWASGRALSVSMGPLTRAGDCDLVLLPDDVDASAEARALGRVALWGRWCGSAQAVDAAATEDGLAWLAVDAEAAGAVERADALLPLGAGLPWFAAGGVELERLDALVRRGVRRVVVGRALADRDAPERLVDDLAERLRQAWNEDPGSDAIAFGHPS